MLCVFAFASIPAAGSCRLVFTSKIDFKHESCLMLPAAMTYAIPGLLLCTVQAAYAAAQSWTLYF